MANKVNYDLLTEFGKRVERKREERGLSRKTVCEKLGDIQDKTYRSWIQKDGRSIDVEHLLMLCSGDVLAVDPDYLLGRIAYETHDNKLICEQTGLSEKSVIYLKEHNDLFCRSALNTVLSSSYAWELLMGLYTYFYRGSKKTPEGGEENGYMSSDDIMKQMVIYKIHNTLDKISESFMDI